MEHIWLELDFGYVLLGVLLDVLTCYVGFTFGEKLRFKDNNMKKQMHVLLGAVSIGVLFWLANICYAFSIQLPFSQDKLLLYSFAYFFLSAFGGYVALKLTSIKIVTTKHYVIGGVLVGAAIVFTNLVGTWMLFNELFAPKLILLALSSLIAMGVAFSLLRFMVQLSRESLQSNLMQWKYVGGLIAGVSFAGFPYLMMTSLLDIMVLNVRVSQVPFSYLIPFCIELLMMLLMGLIPDIFGERKISQQENALKENKAEFDSLFYHHPDGVFAIDLNGKIKNVNARIEKYTGLTVHQMVNQSFLSFVSANDETNVSKYFHDTLEGKAKSFQFKFTNPSGKVLEIQTTFIPTIVDNKIVGVFGTAKDVTELKENERKIHHLAYHDELTGLPNRRYFKAQLKQGIEVANQRQNSFGVMFLDMDRFKKLNDLFGHAFGDQLIRELSFRLRGTISVSCFLARMSGDEFMILLPEINDKEAMAKIASEILDSFEQPLIVDNQECYVTTSIGIAMYPQDANDAETLMKHADIAMYEAKQLGKNTYAFYRQELNERNFKHLMLENDLRKAIDRDELLLHYQPKFNTLTNQITGIEALVRWNHPTHGRISPGDFIPLAEETGLIIPLDKWVLETACTQLKKWHLEGWTSLRLAVNLSARHFHQETIIDDVLSILMKTGVHPKFLELEITESMVMQNDSATINKLLKLKTLGIHISIDDFGTGYSSLSYLQKLPINRLKIDQSFVRDMTENNDSAAIVSMIISMAKHLNLEVVAEGVETKEQSDYLFANECYDIQGYYFSRPLEAEILKQFLCEYSESGSLTTSLSS